MNPITYAYPVDFILDFENTAIVPYKKKKFFKYEKFCVHNRFFFFGLYLLKKKIGSDAKIFVQTIGKTFFNRFIFS